MAMDLFLQYHLKGYPNGVPLSTITQAGYPRSGPLVSHNPTGLSEGCHPCLQYPLGDIRVVRPSSPFYHPIDTSRGEASQHWVSTRISVRTSMRAALISPFLPNPLVNLHRSSMNLTVFCIISLNYH